MFGDCLKKWKVLKLIKELIGKLNDSQLFILKDLVKKKLVEYTRQKMIYEFENDERGIKQYEQNIRIMTILLTKLEEFKWLRN